MDVTRFLFLLLALCQCQPGGCTLKLHNYFADHMVLQRGPQQAVLWGTSDIEGDTVMAKVTGQGSDGGVAISKVYNGKWKLKLPAQTAKGPFAVDVSSSEGHVTLNDVLFGDVWLCFGSTNMQFILQNVNNAEAELAFTTHFPEVRFAQARHRDHSGAVPNDTITFDIPWTALNTSAAVAIGHSSAVCTLFAEYLYLKLQRPIGLVEATYRHLPQVLVTPEVLNACSHHNKRYTHITENSVLWNSLIHPLLSTTLYGALWYQGEGDAGNYEQYACMIEAFVKELRAQFHANSLQQTSKLLPFGYVQIGSNSDAKTSVGYPEERWAQTANYGDSPNPALPHTFMAVAMDLPDEDSPWGPLRPRFKQDVAQRLLLGALNVAYGHNVTFQGPFPTWISIATTVPDRVVVMYNHGNANLTVKNNQGFEVCCSVTNTTHCDDSRDTWVLAPITTHARSSLMISTTGCGTRHVVGVRYEWRSAPCQFKDCSVYDSVSDLPAPPYISHDLHAHHHVELVG